MGQYFQALHEQVKSVLLRCDAFFSHGALDGLFKDSRLSEWWSLLPQVRRREQRVEQTMSVLREQYNVDHENALVLLLNVLSEREDPGSEFHWDLTNLAGKVARALSRDSLLPFRLALQEDDPLFVATAPLVGQVIAGTGCVEIASSGEALAAGEMYRLEVIGTSMEHENIFAGDQVIMRAFNDYEWPNEGDMIVTKYLPLGSETEIPTDLIESELMGPTLKVFHQKANGEFHLGWRKDNAVWQRASWRGIATPGNTQMIVTRYIDPIGKVIDVRRQRAWIESPSGQRRVLGG